MSRIRRPVANADAEEIKAYQWTLAQALERLGVGLGEEFVVSRPHDAPAAGKSRRSDPATSKKAGEAKAYKIGSHKDVTLRLIARYPEGITWRELAKLVEFEGVWKRCSELVDDGMARVLEERLVYGASTPLSAYVITPAGRESIGPVAPPQTTTDERAAVRVREHSRRIHASTPVLPSESLFDLPATTPSTSPYRTDTA